MTQDRSTARDARQWRTTGFRRWWPVLLMASFLGDGTSSVLRLTSRGPSSLPRAGDIVFVVLAALGLIASVVLVVLTQRTQVTLEAEGVAVRAGRRKFFPYQSIDKAYRDRWSSGAVTLQLRDGRQERSTQQLDHGRSRQLLRTRVGSRRSSTTGWPCRSETLRSW